MIFEPINYSDLPEIQNLKPDGWSDIIVDFQFYISATYCKPVKTKLDGKIVGIGALISFDGTGWIGHVIVAMNYLISSRIRGQTG